MKLSYDSRSGVGDIFDGELSICLPLPLQITPQPHWQLHWINSEKEFPPATTYTSSAAIIFLIDRIYNLKLVSHVLLLVTILAMFP